MATMRQIAEQLGLSRATVSLVLNNKPVKISPATRERVLRKARELNYRPSYVAQTLKEGKTYCLGIQGSVTIIASNSPYFATVAAGVERELIETGSPYFSIIFGPGIREARQRHLELTQRGLVDGLIIIVLSFDMPSFEQDIVPLLNRGGIPFVAVHASDCALPYNNVGFDSRRAGYLAGEHLATCGYTDIGYLATGLPARRRDEPLEGLKLALAEHGVPWDDRRLFLPEDPHWPAPGEAEEFIRVTIAGLMDPPRAIFCCSDVVAWAAIRALRERGLAVPQDVAIVGYDDDDARGETFLTSIHHPCERKGREAARMLTAILRGDLPREQAHQVVLAPELAVRRSCGAKG
ncbi:MAG: LacI family DNA-binding transcriptional regulator [Kiritimatiellae bacterium]|nr:LacI family DNA-binding transcriptional regulator [Kiritimatiellia bacterium]